MARQVHVALFSLLLSSPLLPTPLSCSLYVYINATSAGCLLVYNITSRHSFSSVHTWLTDIREHADTHVSCILARNKVDLVSRGAEGEGECFLSFFSLHCLLRDEKAERAGDMFLGCERVRWTPVGWRLAAMWSSQCRHGPWSRTSAGCGLISVGAGYGGQYRAKAGVEVGEGMGYYGSCQA